MPCSVGFPVLYNLLIQVLSFFVFHVSCYCVLATLSFSPVVWRGSLCLFSSVFCPWPGGLHFNHVCSALFAKWDLPLPELRSWVRRRVAVKVFTSLLEEGTCTADTEASMTGKGSSTEVWVAGLDANKLGIKCQSCAGFHKWPCVYSGDLGRKWHLPAPLFLEGSPCDLCLSGGMLWDE